jgi:threonine synthase
MDGPPTFRGITCAACGTTPADPALVAACPSCGGRLDADFAVEASVEPATLPDANDQYRFDPFLPVDRDGAVTMGEGATPLVECPSLAADAGVDRLLVKDEGANPTGSIADRGASLAVSRAAASGAETVALPSTGHAGRSIAAYAGRATLESSVFLPSRAPFDYKAMVNVHGGEMTVAGGRYADAVAAFEDTVESGWADLGPGSPYRRAGLASVYGEVLATLDWTHPEVVVLPASHGATVLGLTEAIDRFEAAGVTSGRPAIVVAQSRGCAPIVDAIRSDGSIEVVDHPDTIAGALEIPAPVLGDPAGAAVRELGGTGVTVTDDDALAAAVKANAEAGVEVGVAGGVALAGTLDEEAALDSADTALVLNPTAGGMESDVLRSHLMGQGV